MNRFRRGAVKEAFDNLPSGVCFFDQNGMVTLCNHQMHRLVFALTGRDLQSLFELRAFLEGDPPVRRENGVFLLDDGSALTETVRTPAVCGVAVVCEGGDQTHVVAQITEMLSSLLGISSSRISVAKMN